jgi:hypothetical protein
MKKRRLPVVLAFLLPFALAAALPNDPPQECFYDVSNKVCEMNAACTLINMNINCRQCWKDSNGPVPTGWTEEDGTGGCTCIWRNKATIAASNATDCSNQGGYWYPPGPSGLCYKDDCAAAGGE